MKDYVHRVIALGFKKKPDTRKADTDIHVSDLKNFCPRAYLLCRRNKAPLRKSNFGFSGVKGGYVALMGHMVQKMFIEIFANADALWGTYKCRHCDHKFLTSSAKAKKCPKCESKALKYVDTTLVLKIGNVTIVGNVDTFLLTEEGKAFVNECKSMKQEFYDRLTEVSLDYQFQVELYLWMLRMKAKVIGAVLHPPKGFLVERGTITYAVKGNHSEPFKVFDIVAGQTNVAERVERQIAELNEHFNKKTLPKKICENQSNLMAKDCAARTICFKQ